MPQLNPNPWFLTLVMTWLIYLMLLLNLNSLKMNHIPLIKNNMYTCYSWKWPWI